MAEAWEGEVEFAMVYIREAHAIDGRSPIVGNGSPLVEEPLHLGERRKVAQVCQRALELDGLLGLVDDVDDAVAKAYQAWPDRLVLVSKDGTISYQSRPGPFGFDPEELDAAIRAELAR